MFLADEGCLCALGFTTSSRANMLDYGTSGVLHNKWSGLNTSTLTMSTVASWWRAASLVGNSPAVEVLALQRHGA